MSIRSKLGAYDLTMIIISLVIGIGIFKTSGIVAAKAGSPTIFYLAWVLGGIVSILGALTFAEIGARLPTAGGFYKVFSHCYHPAFAFMINWSQLIALACSAAAIALVGAEYALPVLPGAGYTSPKIIAVTTISVLFVLNFMGIKMSARAQNVLSGLKIALILLFCTAIFGSKSNTVQPVVPLTAHRNIFEALAMALVPVFYTCGGYQYTINFGADVKNPQRNIPRAILIGMTIIIILYLGINIAYCNVLGFENLPGQPLIAAEMARKFFGAAGYKLTSVVIFISVAGFLNTSFLSNPRVYYAMAEDKILPRIFKRVNERTQTQEFALTFYFGLVVIALLTLSTFEKILNYLMFVNSLSLAFGAATLFILRKRQKKDNYSGFMVKPYPMLPIIFVAAISCTCISASLTDPTAATTGLALLFAGFPLYRLVQLAYKRRLPDKE